jgi:dTDP-4-dehydrorhamnose 3,5-epimerase-like enzyme
MPVDRLETLEEPFISQAGLIQNLVNVFPGTSPIGCVSVLYSHKDAVRANHYHRTDWHRCFIIKGAVDYYERPIGSKEIPEPVRYVENQMFFTPPMVEHALKFAEDTIMVSISKRPRDSESHESDVVRVDFL